MHRLTLAFACFAVLLLSACSTTRVSSSFPAEREKIKSLSVCEPRVYLERLEAGGRVLDADNLNTVKQNYLHAMQEVVQDTKVTVAALDYIDATTHGALIDNFFWTVGRQRKLDDVVLAKDLQDVLQNVPGDYVALGSVSGFSRTSGSYALGVAKGVLIGVLTLGMFYTVPIGSSTSVHLAIVDKASMKVIYFDSKGASDNPKDYDVIKGLEKKIFKEYMANN